MEVGIWEEGLKDRNEEAGRLGRWDAQG